MLWLDKREHLAHACARPHDQAHDDEDRDEVDCVAGLLGAESDGDGGDNTDENDEEHNGAAGDAAVGVLQARESCETLTLFQTFSMT
jgi:hypothetical protein